MSLALSQVGLFKHTTKHKIDSTHCWTDSKVELYWIKCNRKNVETLGWESRCEG